MAGKMKNRIGLKYGRLTVIEFVSRELEDIYWKCQCDCGNEIIVTSRDLNTGTRSCGCLYKDTRHTCNRKHGLCNTRIYRIWKNMKSRCNTPTASKYYLYGGKGIKVCDEWLNDFIAFYNWAMANGYKDNLTIDRIDSDKDYCPENCKWATYKEQNSHLKYSGKNPINSCIIEYNGEKMNLTEWANKLGMNPKTLHARYERGWSIKRMLETPTIREIKRGDDGRWKLS